MSTMRWDPPSEASAREQRLLKRLTRTKKLFAFLREHRHELFSGAFQDELIAMYRETGEGKDPVPPALLAMAVLLQAYTGSSDAETVEMTVVDARWQMVLGVLGSEEAAFSQATFQAFRGRLIEHEMDRRLLERTVELARTTRAFDFRKLPKEVRLAVDSRPLTGAGRVEDTFNLLGHAAHKLLACAAAIAGMEPDELATTAGAPALAAASVKRGLDIDWNDAEQKASAIKKLVMQIERLETWVREKLGKVAEQPPLAEQLATLAQLREQDLEPDPGGGGARIRQGVAEDRRVSIEDREMRHGRKSKSRTFNGYKSHLGADIDTSLVLACGITPANRPEAEALPGIVEDLARYADRNQVGELQIDRGYLASQNVRDMFAARISIICKPWRPPAGERYSKADFKLDLGRMTIRCPAGHTEKIRLGTVTQFPAETCGTCPRRDNCTDAASGRTISIAKDEKLQKKLRKDIASPLGRERMRERVTIEHRLAHHASKQGKRARYVGVRKNLFDARRHAATINLEVLQLAEAA